MLCNVIDLGMIVRIFIFLFCMHANNKDLAVTKANCCTVAHRLCLDLFLEHTAKLFYSYTNHSYDKTKFTYHSHQHSLF